MLTFSAIKVICINTGFIHLYFQNQQLKLSLLIMETDFEALVYLLNLFLQNYGAGENTSACRFLGCAVSHTTQELSLQQKEQYQLRPTRKAQHPAKNTLASQFRTREPTITHNHCSHFLIRRQRARALKIGQSKQRSERTVQLNAAVIFQVSKPKIPIEIYIQAIHTAA